VPAERARCVASDHHVWVAIASFAGSTGGGYDSAAGGSGVWARDGTLVREAGPEAGAIVVVALTEGPASPPGPVVHSLAEPVR